VEQDLLLGSGLDQVYQIFNDFKVWKYPFLPAFCAASSMRRNTLLMFSRNSSIFDTVSAIASNHSKICRNEERSDACKIEEASNSRIREFDAWLSFPLLRVFSGY
jgi:hypothetical protein